MIFTAKGIVKGLLVDWSQITGIPERVLELAALGDPGARRFVVWNDSTNDLEYLLLDAGEVPYDNSGSGLTATDVQAAIDEVYATVTANVFAGYIASGGGSGSLPAGWSVSSVGTGQYQVTHNLGLSSGNDLSVVANPIANDDRYCNIGNSPGTNSFEIHVLDVGAGAVDDDLFFLAKLNA